MSELLLKKNNSITKIVEIDDGKSILDNALDQGQYIPYACKGGVCDICKCKVLKGLEKIKKDKFGDPLIPVEDDEILTCVAGVNDGQEGEIIIEI